MTSALRIRSGSFVSEPTKAWAVPWNEPCIAAGGGISFSTFWIAFTAAPSEALGSRLKEMVVAGNCPMWLMRMGAVTWDVFVTALSGTEPPARGHEVDVLEVGRAGLEARVHLQDHVVLVQLREDRRDLPLAEAVVEAVVDVLGRDPEAGRGRAVERERSLAALRLQVARDVGQLGKGFSLSTNFVRVVARARPRSGPAGCTGIPSG